MSNQTRSLAGAVQDPQRLASVEDFSGYFGIEPKTAYNWRHKGFGPKSFKVGKFVRYRWEDIFAWEQEQIAAEDQ